MLTQIYQREYEQTPISKQELQQKYSLATLPEGHENWTKTNEDTKDTSLNERVSSAKLLLVNEVRSRLTHERDDLEIRDLKDLSAILNNIEDKKVQTQAPTVNVLVQNLTSKFSKEDV